MRFLVAPADVRLDAVGWLFLVVMCVLLPLGALRQHQRLAAGIQHPTRTRIYASAIGTHLVFVLMVWAVVRDAELDLFPPYRPTVLHVAIGLLALAVGLLPALERFRLNDPIAQERVRLIAPRTSTEFGVFYLLSATAGIAEELTYRGLLFTLLGALVRSWVIAALIAAGVFGIVHLFQGWKAAGIAALMGVREQIVVGLTGTLFVAIVVHALHDAIAGTVIGFRARRDELARAQGEGEASHAVS